MTFKHPRYTYLKNNVYYFSKAVPKDLLQHYKTQRIVQCLRTRSTAKAKHAALILSARLEDLWVDLRLRNSSPVFSELLSPVNTRGESDVITASEAKDIYVQTKGVNKNKYFEQGANRYINYLIECLGDRPLDQYSSKDATAYRDWLLERGLSNSSVRRTFSSARAIFNFAISELGLECRNAFSGIYLPQVTDTKVRQALKGSTLRKIQDECVLVNDDIRWLIALISDSGMRLAEAAGLMQTDIVLSDMPHVLIRKHPHRSLKTETSHRIIPLVGYSLWAAQQIKQNVGSDYCFPRYVKNNETNSNSASAASNKWLKIIAGKDATVHGMRHGLRDRLRAVEAPLEITDQIGGWSLKSIGQGYGDGYSLAHMAEWMEKIVAQ